MMMKRIDVSTLHFSHFKVGSMNCSKTKKSKTHLQIPTQNKHSTNTYTEACIDK